MSKLSGDDRLVRVALGIAVLVPIIYFGIQLIAAPLYPGYSFLSRDASTLGSDGSSGPWIFNTTAIIVGIITLIAAWGFWRAFVRFGTKPLLAGLTCAALVSFGLGSFNAGVHPLPDSRHTAGLLALAGMGSFLLPALLPAALWKLQNARGLKIFLASNLVALIVLLPILSGMIQVILVKTGLELPAYQNFLNNYHGLLQRIAAFILIAPIGVVAYFLAIRLTAVDRESASPYSDG